jgi:hypothetical protein
MRKGFREKQAASRFLVRMPNKGAPIGYRLGRLQLVHRERRGLMKCHGGRTERQE